jgi:hypothetical protein
MVEFNKLSIGKLRPVHGKSISVITSGRQRWLLQQRSNSKTTLLKLLPPSRGKVG